MRRISTLAVLTILVLAAFPPLDGASGAARTPAEAAALGGLDLHFPAQLDTFHFFNTDVNIYVNPVRWYRRGGGAPVLQQDLVIPGRSMVTFPLPAALGAGFDGSLLYTSDGNVRAIVNRLGDGTADSLFAAIPGAVFGSQPSPNGIGHPFFGNQPYIIQNANVSTQGPIVVQSFISDLSGTQTATSRQTSLREGEIRQVRPNQVPGASSLLQTRAHFDYWPLGNAVAAWTTVPTAGEGDVGDWISSLGFSGARREVCAPFPGSLLATGARVSFSTINIAASVQDILTDLLAADGRALDQQTNTVPAGGMAERSYGFEGFPRDGRIACARTTSGDASLLGVEFYDFGPENGSRLTPASGGWRAVGTDDAITKLGYAFGAPATKSSKVSVVLHNAGDKKAKVKVTVYRARPKGNKKVFSRTVRIDPRGTATVPYLKRARGDDLFAELKVRGKGAILAWLQRTFENDVDYYPAAKVR